MSAAPAVTTAPKLTVSDLCIFYGEKKGVGPVSLDITEKNVTALIGPSASGSVRR